KSAELSGATNDFHRFSSLQEGRLSSYQACSIAYSAMKGEVLPGQAAAWKAAVFAGVSMLPVARTGYGMNAVHGNSVD
ncbi:MAG: hypothetical protein ACUVXG_10870, partial [Anaerolineae bacterium]